MPLIKRFIAGSSSSYASSQHPVNRRTLLTQLTDLFSLHELGLMGIQEGIIPPDPTSPPSTSHHQRRVMWLVLEEE